VRACLLSTTVGGVVIPAAAASASTMRRTAASTRVRLWSLTVRTLMLRVASAGTTLSALPAWIAPTETTTISPGSDSRDTMLCSLTTAWHAVSRGSTVVCGREPCPPRPWKVTVTESEPAIVGPGRTPTIPAGSGATC